MHQNSVLDALELDRRVDALLGQMTLPEKISLLSGKDIWNTVPVPRLGIPSIAMTDGPHGVRAPSEAGRASGPCTCFPTGVSMAACWNPDLVEQVGQALGDEARGMDCDILLGPCINIVRYPLGGRNFEAYSEDPYLAGRIAVAMVNGIQSRGVGASLKHFAANNHETERGRASSRVDERTLREIYLPHFEMVVKEARPWTVMCSYNRLNGVYASQHEELLTWILRDEWGFDGAVISDWGANHSIVESVSSGLDLEMPGPAKYFAFLLEAAFCWQIDEAIMDRAARRILKLVVQSGRMERRAAPDLGTTQVNTPAHQALARQLAEEAITLLKNDGGVLPIDPARIKSLAILGPNAAEVAIQGGGSSHVEPPYRVSALQALQERLAGKVELTHERGCDNFDIPFQVPPGWLLSPDGKPGLRGELYASPDLSGAPGEIREASAAEFWRYLGSPAQAPALFSARWQGRLVIPGDGVYRFNFRHRGIIRLYLDGKLALESATPDGPALLTHEADADLRIRLEGGRPHDFQLDHTCYPGQEVASFRLGIAQAFAPGEDPRLARAVEAARRADVALVFVGYPEGFETEGADRASLDLPGGQNELVALVAAANPRTVVVVNAGAPVTMPWVESAAAVVDVFCPGMEAGHAVAAILLGEVNPSGKLPITFPKRLEDNPAFPNSPYPGAREVRYEEGLYVGYRHYERAGVEPLFPFGWGLSYTSFEYDQPRAPQTVKAGESVSASVRVTNTGAVAGKEVVQLYISDPDSSLPRPRKELKGFAKVALGPGESREVVFSLDGRAFSFYDPARAEWMLEPGFFDLHFCASSAAARASVRIRIE